MALPTPAKKQRRAPAKKTNTPKKRAAPRKASAKKQAAVEEEDEGEGNENMASGANQDEVVGPGHATPPLHGRGEGAEPAQEVPSEVFEDPLPEVWDDHIVRQPEDLNGRRYDSLNNADKIRVADIYAAEFHEQKISNGGAKFHSRVLSTPAASPRAT
jgi:hypothetical protein